MHKILCVEDSLETLTILEASMDGHMVFKATNMKDAENFLKKEKFSCLILDIVLPDGDGIDFLSKNRVYLHETPVLILTGKQDYNSKVSAFALGADDFISKPFDPRELRLRVDSKIKKMESLISERTSIRLGNLVCNIAEQRIATQEGQAVDLTSLEFRVFCLLAQSPTKIFSRTEILEKVWGGAVSVTDRAVDVHVSNLRKKIISFGVSIEAVVGSGYRIQIQ